MPQNINSQEAYKNESLITYSKPPISDQATIQNHIIDKNKVRAVNHESHRWRQIWETISIRRTKEVSTIFVTSTMTSLIMDIISTEEAILTISESLYGKYNMLDIV